MSAFLSFPHFLSFLHFLAFLHFLPGYKPGDIADDFSLPAVCGDTIRLSDYKQVNGVIVIFYSPSAVIRGFIWTGS